VFVNLTPTLFITMQRVREFNSNPTHNNAAELKTRRGIYGSPQKKIKRSNIQIEHPNVAVKKREPEFD